LCLLVVVAAAGVVGVVGVVVGTNYHDYWALQVLRKQFDIGPANPTARGSGGAL